MNWFVRLPARKLILPRNMISAKLPANDLPYAIVPPELLIIDKSSYAEILLRHEQWGKK